jgi:hypothetical protein
MTSGPAVKGVVSLFNVLENGEWLKLPNSEEENQIQWSWGEIACNLFGDGRKEFKISGMYIEFENTALIPSTPSYTRSEGVEYYESLSGSLTKDFLRVTLLSPPIKALAATYSNINYNQLTFLAQTAGTQGVHGKTFSDSVSSKVYGLALVATPVWGDRTQDLIFARKYYTTPNQVAKQAGSQIGVNWTETFK